MCIARHAQSTQNKLALSSQYLKESLEDEVDFLPANKHRSLLQADGIALGLRSQACPKYLKSVSIIFAISQGKHKV